jgi:hypothetical protein
LGQNRIQFQGLRILNYICLKSILQMKQLAYIFTLVALVTFTACGGDEGADNPEDGIEEVVNLKGFEELDLTEWGFNLKLMVPEAEIHGDAEVVLTERGALEILVGSDFGLEIMFGEGDIELLKMDLKEDLVFKSEIVKEGDNFLVYSQDIPDSGVKTQNHFFYKAVVGSDIYEVRDIMEGEYGSGMIEKMLEAAKTLKSTTAAEVAA